MSDTEIWSGGGNRAVKTVNAEGAKPGLGPDDAARKRAAVEIYARSESTLKRAARRFSLCEDDAEDALQRSLEILLRKAPTDNPRELIKWMQIVVKHEALAIRHERERTLAGPAAFRPEPEMDDWVALLPTPADGPPERAERREAVARSREALQALKPQELRTLTLLAEGYSYAEIGEITGFSKTKINRCAAEGRERFRDLVTRSEVGDRCRELGPLLSAFCDGEAKPAEVAELREHLRACAQCRATVRTYRATPAAAAALAPAVQLHASLWERARDALGDLLGRFGGGGASQAAAGGGVGGVAAVAKIAAVCIGVAGGATACVAAGLVPGPLDLGADRERPAVERRLSEIPPPAPQQPAEGEQSSSPAPEPKQKPTPVPAPEPEPESEPAAAEPAPVPSEPEGEATEYVPPPEPVAEPAPVASSGGGSPAGEFGPGLPTAFAWRCRSSPRRSR
jgi:RNA polymerase sigma factor (sigma-70 family)